MSKPRQQGPHGTPGFIDLLSPNDRKLYDELQQNVGSPDFRYNRNRRISTLMDIFEYIRDYCEYSEEDQWKRYLVCGICWFKDCVAINTRQLRLLIAKSKSAINGAFVKMGYQTIPTKGEERTMLLEKIPFLSSHYSDLRQWTIRKMDPLLVEKQLNSICFENSNEINLDESKENENKKETESKKETENTKDDWISNDEYGIFDEDPFQTYGPDGKCNKDPSEPEFSFINFNNDNYDFDFDFNFTNSNVFTLFVNPNHNINLSDIREAMKNSRYSKEDNYSKDFNVFLDKFNF